MQLRSILVYSVMAALVMAGCSVHRAQTSYGDKGVARLLNETEVPVRRHGLVIYDPAQKSYLFEQDADQFFTPASNTKIATLCAALHYLGDSTTALRYESLDDTLVFWGAYDPAFLYDSTFVSGRAFRLLKEHQGPLVYAPLPDVDRYGPGWAWDDYNAAYQAERSTFPMYGNQVTVTAFDDGLFVAEPPFFRSYFSVNTALRELVRRSPDVNAFEINPYYGNRHRNVDKVPFICSPYQTMELLTDTLGRRVDIAYGFDHQDAEYASVQGEPLAALYCTLMQDSDNFIAEQLLLQCSMQVDEEEGASGVIAEMMKGPFSEIAGGVRWIDGSGLSRYNLMTPRSVIYMLDHLLNEQGWAFVREVFPAGGVSGTISDRFKGDMPYVYAKSGTLRNNYALSGYLVTESGRLLLFSSMHGQFVESSDEVKNQIEVILQYIRDNF